MKTLMLFVEDFLNARDVSQAYANLIRTRCRAFARFLGRSVHIDEIDSASVNAWLAWLQTQRLRPATIAGYKRNLCVVWRDAFDAGLNNNPPLRIKRVKVPQQVVRAYTHAEIRALLHAASRLHGRHRNGNRRAEFWQALIHSAYSTALRRSDLLLVFRHQIQSDGSAVIVQSKTGFSHRVKFSPQALYHASRLADNNGLLLPWPYRRDSLSPRFQIIKRMAGIKHGSLKWLRRSAASYAEREESGAGAKLLGHRGSKVFRASYDDPTISGQRPAEPPPL
jgi:site-specific recombinase XerD